MPSDEPLWLPREEVIEINREIVALTGEPFGLVRPDLLESALANPQNKYVYGGEKDILVLALALLFAICRNHPFLQGNKRTAFIAAENFLQINGYILTAPDSEELAELIIDCIANKDLEQQLEDYLRDYIVAAPSED